MKWFKFYGEDYLSDPKMLSLSSSERSCWITLLAYGSVNDNGMITFLSEEQLMAQAGISPSCEDWDYTKGILEKLVKLKMITIDNGMITILNWRKRQDTSLTSYERVKRYRKKHKNDNAMITLEENRREENRKEDKKEGEQSSQLISKIIDSFKGVNSAYKKWFGNKTQRSACDRLLNQHGVEQILKVIAILPKTNNMPYMPKITTPLQLEDKWASLEAQLKSKKAETLSSNSLKVNIII